LRGQWRDLDEALVAMTAKLDRLATELEIVAAGENLSEEVLAALHSMEELGLETEMMLESIRSSLEELERLGPADVAARERVLEQLQEQAWLTEQARQRREEKIREFRSTNQELRRRWIAGIARRLGLSDEQYRGVVDLYDQQSDAWSELYERVQSEALATESLLEEMNRIRGETEDALSRILGPELRDQFRLDEQQLFPRRYPTDSSR